MTSPGIGGGGLLGVALEVLTPPVQDPLATATTGGTLAAGTYRYYVTATNADGETTVSNEESIVTTGATSTVTVTWTAVTGATGYKIYRTAVDGASGTQLLLATVGAVTTYEDDGSGTPSGAFPTINTATTAGTYKAPTKFIPFNSESLMFRQGTGWRRPIRKSVDVLGGVPGNVHIEGDVELETTEDTVLYFMYCARASVVKTGTSPNFVYTFTPTPLAVPAKTMSITVERNGETFGYVGCVVSSFRFGINEGQLTFSVSIVGRDEASQTDATPTWPTTTPYGAGQFDIEIPTGTAVTDTDTFEFAVEDNAEPQFRLKSTGRGAEFVKFGERNTTLTMERDFLSRTDYDAFKALTAQSITLKATKGADNEISILVPAAVKDTYETNLSSQGDLVRAAIATQNVLDSTGKSYEIAIKSQENI